MRNELLRRESSEQRAAAAKLDPHLEPLRMAWVVGWSLVVSLLVAGCAKYPQVYADGSSCVPLYGGTLVTLPTPGYRMPDGGFIPEGDLLINRDGGVWKC